MTKASTNIEKEETPVLDAQVFCATAGVSRNDTSVILRRHAGKRYTETKWVELLKKDFALPLVK